MAAKPKVDSFTQSVRSTIMLLIQRRDEHELIVHEYDAAIETLEKIIGEPEN